MQSTHAFAASQPPADDVVQLTHLMAERRTAAQRMSTHPTDDDLLAFLACDTAVDALMSRLEAEMGTQPPETRLKLADSVDSSSGESPIA